jgi:hypothetical protein
LPALAATADAEEDGDDDAEADAEAALERGAPAPRGALKTRGQ